MDIDDIPYFFERMFQLPSSQMEPGRTYYLRSNENPDVGIFVIPKGNNEFIRLFNTTNNGRQWRVPLIREIIMDMNMFTIFDTPKISSFQDLARPRALAQRQIQSPLFDEDSNLRKLTPAQSAVLYEDYKSSANIPIQTNMTSVPRESLRNIGEQIHPLNSSNIEDEYVSKAGKGSKRKRNNSKKKSRKRNSRKRKRNSRKKKSRSKRSSSRQ